LKIEKIKNRHEIKAMDYDTYNLQSMMKTCLSFLQVNDFDISEQPNYKEMDNQDFVETIEEKMGEEENELFKFMEKVNIEITFRSAMSGVYGKNDDELQRILILFFPDDTVTAKNLVKEPVKKFLNLMLLLGCQDGVLISEKHLAPVAKKDFYRCNVLSDETEGIYNVIFYNDTDFVDIIEHISTPKVLKVYRSKEEIEKFNLENRVILKKLPSIGVNDPLAKFYRARIGNIFKFLRTVVQDNVIEDEELAYSLVIPPVDIG
jgi:DNA-directed RNA polymerase subunit H (RpoH/RPB5)